MRGLASGRKGARQGFFIALTEVNRSMLFYLSGTILIFLSFHLASVDVFGGQGDGGYETNEHILATTEWTEGSRKQWNHMLT